MTAEREAAKLRRSHCVITPFDERKPEMARLMASATEPEPEAKRRARDDSTSYGVESTRRP